MEAMPPACKQKLTTTATTTTATAQTQQRDITPQPEPTTCATATSSHADGPITQVILPRATIEVSTRIVRTTRRYRTKVNGEHWVFRWDRTGRLSMARSIRRVDNP